jgi:uncharacterized protein YjbI with pentapeptide repeats
MADEEHLQILKQGVKIWNRWRGNNTNIQPDLREADLHGANFIGVVFNAARLGRIDLSRANLSRAHLIKAHLSRANLSWADLRGAYFREADLREADLRGADLREANLSEASLSGANLSGANLGEADLNRADLREANFGGVYLIRTRLSMANLSGANLRGATAGNTIFANLDLSAAKGLNAARHDRPSYIDIHTIYRSHSQIPEAFLRGCGVPDNFIAYMGSLTGKAFEYYSCFICYSTKDQTFAERLHNDLQGKGVRCWFAPEDIQGGKKIFDQIDQQIRLHDKTLLVLSEHSIHSQWVETEIRRTRKAEARDGRQKLFPIRLVDWDVLKEWECFDATTGQDLADEVREYFIPDFSHWETHAAYKPAFDRLLRDLKAEEG